MRLVAYTRLSQANEREGESHAAQLDRITAWAQRHGYHVVLHHTDTTSGENGLEQRVGLGATLDALARAEADALVFSQLDRLSRDVIVQESVLRDVWREGHDAFSAAEGEARLRDDPDDPSRRLIRVMLGAVAEYERAMIALRMARGRRRAIARGRSIGPAPSFGWVKDPEDRGRLVPDPSTFELASEAAALIDQGKTLADVAQYLSRQTGRVWHPTQVARLRDRYKRYAAPEVPAAAAVSASQPKSADSSIRQSGPL